MNNVTESPEEPAFSSIWHRVLYMLLFVVLYGIAELVVYAVAVFQLLWVIVNGSSNPNLMTLGQGLSLWVSQVFRFLTFNSDDLPYPFSPWPN